MLSRILPAAGPGRVLAVATLLMTVGQGAFMTCSALYFTTVAGLSVPQWELGLTIAAAVGLFAGIPLGHLADRRGPRGTTAVLVALNGLAAAAYLLVGSFAQFVLVACVFVVMERGSRSALQAAVAGALKAYDLVSTRAYLRSVTNVGVALGAALAGVALNLGSATALRTVLVMDALAFLASAATLTALPPLPAASPAKGEHQLAVLRDRPFALVTALSAVLSLPALLLEMVIPLWIAHHTSAPRWMVTVLFLVNSAGVIAFQVRIAKGVADLSRAVRAARLAGGVQAAACLLFAASSTHAALVSVTFLVLAAGVQVYGEMVFAAAAWTIGFDLAPPHRQGQYQGFFFTGYALAVMAAPTCLTGTVVGGGTLGWLVPAVLFAAAGLALGPAVGWAERNRPAVLVASGG
ncbi:MFS transporter [Streptomyces sp. TG1A-8]|uniref:MFS transporter n=1 Tax=Streptomyces sp. TG1A-8 TaxID=3051385 RepID=UPI00265BFB66|nr:MFS transporter [Streptomyces sp. TG1A-8]MDO0928867.1 MFS transporter [Streptomyces sp. TG1A-8]